MLGFKTIARKLPLALVASALIVSLGVGTGAYLIASQMVGDMAERNLGALAHERAKQVQDFLSAVTSDLQTTANSQATNQAIRDFGNAWLQIQGDRAAVLQTAFVANNPNAPDKRMLLDQGPAELNYSPSHLKYNPGFRQQMMSHGYADIYLVGADGNVYYSVAKQADFTANVKADGGPLAGSGLAKVFAAATAQTAPGGPVVFADFAPYGADKQVSAFAALPLFNTASGRMMGIVAIRFLPPLLGAVVGDRTGLGDSGEVLVVGPDHLLRVDSSFDAADNVLATPLASPAVDAALGGTAATGESTGYRNADMIVAASPVDSKDVNWAVAAVMTRAEAFGPIATLRDTMLLVGGALDIDSLPGHGATIRMRLPLAEAPEAPAVTPERPPEPRPVERDLVMVVDDVVAVRRFLVESLSAAGYEVVEAPGPDAALELLARHRPRLLVTDQLMPGLTGAELAARAVTLQPGLRVLVVTGNLESPAVGSIPGASVLHKPFDAPRLAAAVAAALARDMD